MLKFVRLNDYCFPYVILVSIFLQFEVNLDEELKEVVKSSNEINNGSLIKMGFVKVNMKKTTKNHKSITLMHASLH